MNKKIKIISSLIFLFIFVIPSFTFAQEKNDQYYIDRIATVQSNIDFKINNIIPNLNHISDDYKNNLISEFTIYDNSLDSFEADTINGECSADIRLNNFLINKAKAQTCIPTSAEDLFRDAVQGDRSLSKKIFTYKSCNNLLDSIENNLTLVNTILYLLEGQTGDSLSSDNVSLVSNLETSVDDLTVLIAEIDNVVADFGALGYDKYDQIRSLRQQFVDRDSGDYANFFNIYSNTSSNIISNVQSALVLLSDISINNSYIHPDKRYFYNDQNLSLNVSIKDYFGEPLPNLDVNLYAYQDGVLSGLSISPTVIKTNSDGTAKGFELTSTMSGKIDFKAVVSGVDLEIEDVATAMQVFSASNSSIQANPDNIVTGETSEVVVTARDVYNKLIIGKNVKIDTLTKDTTVTITPLSGRTNRDGEITFQISKSSIGSVGTKVNVDYLEILSENLIQVVPPINIDNSSITANPTKITVLSQPGDPLEEGYYSTLIVTLRDNENKVIPDIAVGLRTNLRLATITPSSGNTDANGEVGFIISSLDIGLMNFIATAPGFEMTVSNLINVVVEPAQAECEAGGGVWDLKILICSCEDPALVWSDGDKACVSIEVLIQECEAGKGIWDPKTSICTCKDPSLVWNSITKICEK